MFILRALGIALAVCGSLLITAAGMQFYDSETGLRNIVAEEATVYVHQVPRELPVPTGKLKSPVVLDGTISIESEGLNAVLFEGTADKQLDRGVGHYLNTALPGQEGNFAVAAHRGLVPDIDQMGAGDEIVIVNQGIEYVYEWRESFVVSPDAVEVLNPIEGRWLTLTTCHPRYSNEQRLIVRAELTSPGQ